MSANFERVTGFMRDLGDVVGRELRARLKLSDKECMEIGMHCSRKACEMFGGELLYVGKGMALKLSERDREMYVFYVRSGRNIQATAKQFHLGMQGAYKRIRRIEKQWIKTNQVAFADADGKSWTDQ